MSSTSTRQLKELEKRLDSLIDRSSRSDDGGRHEKTEAERVVRKICDLIRTTQTSTTVSLADLNSFLVKSDSVISKFIEHGYNGSAEWYDRGIPSFADTGENPVGDSRLMVDPLVKESFEGMYTFFVGRM
jgi:hypothetical protein